MNDPLSGLPVRLRRELHGLGRKYRPKGIDVVVFGSWAQRRARKTSDLDLGVIWKRPVDRALFSQLAREVEDLPTIRPVDLVDFSEVSTKFRAEAQKHLIPLGDEA